MQIQSQKYNPQFGAIHIANCGKLKLYNLTDTADYKFLKALPINIRMQDRMPNLNKDAYFRWNEMLEYAVDNALNPKNITYLESLGNKACGIITFQPGNITKLDCICTWPVEFGKKVQLAGKNLFYQLFTDFQKFKGKKIQLDAITNGPYDTVEKYKSLGFTPIETYPTKIKMESSAHKIKETLKSLSQKVDYNPTEHEKVNLLLDLDI